MSTDWRDGFLFVGNQLALDFLNTRLVMDGQPVELLPDCGALARWLAASELITSAQARRLGRRWSSTDCAPVLTELLGIRESLREAVSRMEAGRPPSAGFISEVNRLLREYPWVDQVAMGESGLERRKRFVMERPGDAFAPVADAIAGLLTGVDRSRLRKCRGCVVHFHDTSKKGTRIWCSMKMCGNRFKVAAFAGRKRAAPPENVGLSPFDRAVNRKSEPR